MEIVAKSPCIKGFFLYHVLVLIFLGDNTVLEHIHSVDVEGCDTPGRFAIGCGGNFHGVSLILKIDEGGNTMAKQKNSYSFKGVRTPYLRSISGQDR